jgi:hypothetical protein
MPAFQRFDVEIREDISNPRSFIAKGVGWRGTCKPICDDETATAAGIFGVAQRMFVAVLKDSYH